MIDHSVLCSSQDNLGTRTHDLDHLVLSSVKNTDSWRVRKEDLQHAFPLNVPLIPSSVLTVAADSERLSCGGFSLSETICFGSLEFIADHFSGLSLSPMGDGSDAIIMGSAYSGPPSPLQAMMGDSTEEFHMALGGEGRINLPSPRRRGTGASPAHATTISRSESTLTSEGTMTIPPRQALPQPNTDLPLERCHAQSPSAEQKAARR
jgi:hypothetical protein